jgi:hypothetical protein
LPSWQDGPARRAIMDFVKRVTTPSGTDFVPERERIATFDNDGTLWAEQPIYFQFAFVLDRIKAMAPQHPDPTGLPMRSIRASSGRTSSWCTSRCSSCSLPIRKRLQDLHRLGRWGRVHARLRRDGLRHPA